MKDLNYFKDKIKERRKQTSFRDYLKEIVSHFPMIYYKNAGIISKFPETDRVGRVIPVKDFEKNVDELLKNGIEYDGNISFFENYEKLFVNTKIFNVINHGSVENSDYADMIYNSKNAYLSTVVINDCENVLYSISTKDNCTNVLNSIATWSNSENIYYCSGVLSSFKIYYSRFINDSDNIWFSSNLIGCSECIGCHDLQNKKFCIENKQYSKQDYFEKKKDVLKHKENFEKRYGEVDKKGNNINSQNTTGSSMFSSSNVENGYFGYYVKNGRNTFFTGGISGDENMYDVFTAGSPTGHDFYGVMGANGENLYCCKNVALSSNVFYSYGCTNCSFCIGCIGLKNQSYCVLNRQYTKEEFEKLSSEIFKNMENDGTLGEFFPGKLNPFYFNDTLAGLIGGFKREEVINDGYMWREEKIKVDIPDLSTVISVSDLDNYEGYNEHGDWKLNPEVLEKGIKDESGNYYRIVQAEYDFLVKHGLPLPRLHWLDRIKFNFGV